MRRGKSFGNRLDFWKVRPWGKHQAEHKPAYAVFNISADTEAFASAIRAMSITLGNLDTP